MISPHHFPIIVPNAFHISHIISGYIIISPPSHIFSPLASSGHVPHHFAHEFPIQTLREEAGLADAELAAYARRLSLVQAIYEDRGQRRPQLPWEDDSYRRCQYQVG